MFNTLLSLLPHLSKISNSNVILSHKNGSIYSAVDSKGNELEEYRKKSLNMILENLNNKYRYLYKAQTNINFETISFPINEYIITYTNVERIDLIDSLFVSIKEKLPNIASVIGGDAALCDNNGNVIISVNSLGNLNHKIIGKVSKNSKMAMDSQKLIIGKSNRVKGATAVRIPIGKSFLFGFNNEDSVREKRILMDEVRKHRTTRYSFEDIIGNSDAILKAKKLALMASQSQSNVLIYGESGTGKEVFAQSIHNASRRSNHPFIAINCGSIPQSLAESIFFGYEHGAFTGAKKGGSPGVFEQANNGTIFLDEIGEMNFNLQSQLLRVLQGNEVRRIGSNANIKLNIRVICATNKNLVDLIEKDKFRQDLYFRLNVLDINLPDLTSINDDIPLLVDHIINNMNEKFNKSIDYMDDEALEVLKSYHWTGNVRELTNCIEKIFNIINDDKVIKLMHIPNNIIKRQHEIYNKNADTSLKRLLEDYEKTIITTALRYNNNSKIKTANYLEISTTTLWRKIKELNIIEVFN